MAELTVISWRDIPAQVIARSGRARASIELPSRFQIAIDRAAMIAGLSGSDAYLEEWRRTSRPCGEDLDAEASAEAERLEATHPPEAIDRLVEGGGRADGSEGGAR